MAFRRLLIAVLFLSDIWPIYGEILTTNLSNVIQNAEVIKLVEEFGRFCEGTKLCNVNVSAPDFSVTDDGIKVPCCGDCRCDDECYVDNDCCPDVILRVLEKSEVDSRNSNPRRCTQVQYPSVPLTERLIPSYEMVSRCPLDFLDQTVREKCERDYDKNDMSNVDIVDIIPYSDTTSLISYKNLYCAICSGVKQVVPWTSKLLCEDFMPMIFQNGILKLGLLHERPKCKLSFQVQESVRPGVKRCKYFIDRCQLTGNNTEENSFLERACASYTSVYKHYKNVHCFLCSGDTGQSVTEECFLAADSGAVGYTGILYFGEQYLGMEDDIALCNFTGVYEKATNICPHIYCSAMMRLFGLKCEQYYTQAYPVSYELRVRLIPPLNYYGIENFLMLIDNIKDELQTFEDVGLFMPCLFDFDIHLNISEAELEDVEAVKKATAFEIDLRVVYRQDSPEKSDVAAKIKIMLKMYETIRNISISGNIAVEYVADDPETSVIDSRNSDKNELKIFPPASTNHELLLYYLTADNLISVTHLATVLDLICFSPVSIDYLHKCAKVILSNESFDRKLDEKNTPILKVLDEVIKLNEVIFTPDRNKIMLCAEKFLQIMASKEIKDQDNYEIPVSRAKPETAKIHTVTLMVLISMTSWLY